MLCRLLLAFTLSTFSAVSQAALVISVDDAFIQVDGTSFVDIRIESNESDGSDSFSLFEYEFHITPLAGAVGDLRFTNPQLLTEQADSEYVFDGDTESLAISSDPQNGPAFDQITGGDGTSSGLNAPITSSDNFLLARLELTHAIAGDPNLAVGSQWTISLQNTAFTEFEDENGAIVNVDATSFTNFGTITATAVPEPSSIALLAVIGVAGIARRCKRKRFS